MSSKYKNLFDFGHCQQQWYAKSARNRNKLSIKLKVISIGLSSLVTVVLLFESSLTPIIAAILSWMGGLIAIYIDESKIKILAEKERAITEKLRIVNAQCSAGVITDDDYKKKLISILSTHVQDYIELTKKENKD